MSGMVFFVYEKLIIFEFCCYEHAPFSLFLISKSIDIEAYMLDYKILLNQFHWNVLWREVKAFLKPVVGSLTSIRRVTIRKRQRV